MKPPVSPGGISDWTFLAQVLALGFVLDALRDADVRVLRQVDEEPPGDRDLGREARSLAADRILHHLHEQRLALAQDPLDGLLDVVAVARGPDVGHVQEGRARQADLDERRLHPGKDAADAAQVDVAHEPPARVAFDVQLLHRSQLGDRDPRFLRGDVDQDLLVHLGLRCV
jgi:hypothetical protein